MEKLKNELIIKEVQIKNKCRHIEGEPSKGKQHTYKFTYIPVAYRYRIDVCIVILIVLSYLVYYLVNTTIEKKKVSSDFNNIFFFF